MMVSADLQMLLTQRVSPGHMFSDGSTALPVGIQVFIMVPLSAALPCIQYSIELGGFQSCCCVGAVQQLSSEQHPETQQLLNII